MKNILKKSKVFIVYLFAILLGLSTSVIAATTDDYQLQSTLKVANSTVGTDYEKTVSAKADDVVKYEVYYHNNEYEYSGHNINGLNLKVTLPTSKATSHVANLAIGGSNSNHITDSATVTTQIPTTMQFIAGTVYRRYNSGTNANPNWVTVKISDAIVTSNGFTIPSMKPCYNFLETIVFQARVMAPVVSIVKQVKVEGTNTWVTNLTAKPGDTLAYLITFKNEGNVTLNNLIVRDNLPAGLEYVNGSTKITNTLYPNGVQGTDDVTKGGIIIGNYLPGANGYVRFNATVPAISAECGKKVYTNVGVVKANELGEFYNTAIVTVDYPCTPPPPPVTPPVTPPGTPPVTPPTVVVTETETPLPASGPVEATAGAAGLTFAGGAGYVWLRSKKALLSALTKIK